MSVSTSREAPEKFVPRGAVAFFVLVYLVNIKRVEEKTQKGSGTE